MTHEEILLVKELIKETVKSVVKEALNEVLDSVLKKDIKEVKLLLAKTIKEGYLIKEQKINTPVKVYDKEGSDELRKKIREAVGGDFTPTKTAVPKFVLTEEQGHALSTEGTLPEFDAPIPKFNKNSPVWKDMEDKIK
jgi:hypothetical protein